VLKEILEEGNGTGTPHTGCTVSLHYTGRLVDGTEFDSSVGRNKPFEFPLGKGNVIKDFDKGMATMKIGDRCFLTCAPNYAYGAAGSPPAILRDATLIFELEMRSWKGEDLSPNQDGSIDRTIERTPSDGAFVKAHISGAFEGRMFEDRDVEFDYGEGHTWRLLQPEMQKGFMQEAENKHHSTYLLRAKCEVLSAPALECCRPGARFSRQRTSEGRERTKGDKRRRKEREKMR